MKMEDFGLWFKQKNVNVTMTTNPTQIGKVNANKDVLTPVTIVKTVQVDGKKNTHQNLVRMLEAKQLALRQVGNFFDFKKEKKRLERNGETKELGSYGGFGIIRDPFQE